MRFYSLLPLSSLFLAFGSCRPGTSQDVQPIQAFGFGNAQGTATISDVSDPQYLKDHGYFTWDMQDMTYWIFSDPLVGSGVALKITIDMERKSATILDNSPDQGLLDQENPRLPQIFQAFCYKENIPCKEMKSIVIDISDSFTHRDVENYRQGNDLGPEQEFEIAANQPGWEIFSPTAYYKHATGMLPSVEAEKIVIKQERRDSESARYAAVIAEVMIVSFKQLGLKDEDTVVSPTDAHGF
ncbi:hypothetical protein HOO65_030429 [Ceratocystis lukuohia]|uniref:Uncharacterized protein n=1 Tax=Ceratocystis lukuohia TaxID=2019550 RepID=A0ABR4MKW0_9PEZI